MSRDTAESNKSVETWKKFLVFALIIHCQHAMQQCAIMVLQKGLFSNNLEVALKGAILCKGPRQMNLLIESSFH